MRDRSWWHRRAVDCITSYWVYQHLGNLSPAELDASEIYREVRGNQQATEVLRSLGRSDRRRRLRARAGASTATSAAPGRSSSTPAPAACSRPDRRAIVDDEEWDWIVEHCSGDFDHLLLATTVPFLLSPAFDRLEAWNERALRRRLGIVIGAASELLRREVDFDHWAAFQESFAQMRDLLGGDREGRARQGAEARSSSSPATSTTPTSASSAFPATPDRSPIYQAVCSPYRNPLEEKERRVVRAAFGRVLSALARGLAKLAGAPDPGCRWRLLEGPCFDNQVSTLTLDGDEATLRLERTAPGETRFPGPAAVLRASARLRLRPPWLAAPAAQRAPI